MINKKGVVLTVISLFFALAFFNVLTAQNTPAALTVHPTNVDIESVPGQGSQGSLFVRNTTKQTVTVKPELRNFTAEGEEGGIEITTENTPFSLASWMSVSPTTSTIKPGEVVEFKYEVNPPSNAEAGGHFGSVVFKTVPDSNTKGTGAVLSQEIASLFLVRIPGPVVENASILSFSTEKKFYEKGPITFDVRVKDEGGVHIRPAGVITVTDMFGNKSVFGFQGQNVLPGAIRKMPAVWDSGWLIGKYEAGLALAYGSKNSQLYANTEFWAFPVKPALVVAVVLIVLFFFRRRLWRALKVILRGK
jgi:hypothetical protein